MAGELEISVEEATIENTDIGDTILGIYTDELDPREEHYFGRVFEILEEDKSLLVAWEYDEEDLEYEIDLKKVQIEDVYKLIDIQEHKPTRKMPKKSIDILETFK